MPSDTVVFQSFRTHDVPAWITRSMETARAWADLRGFDYQFLDDRFFDRIPDRYRARTENKVILSDLARLLVSRELLGGGYQRVVWVDADVAVFDPQAWVLPTESRFYFCHELWPIPMPDGLKLEIRANNAVMVFSRANSFLDFYIDSCCRILDTDEPLKSWHLGVRFLTAIRNVCPLPVLTNVGMIGADLLRDMVAGPKLMTAAYIKSMSVPLVAANMCASALGASGDGFTVTEEVFHGVVEQLIDSKGQSLNQYLTTR
jgi:hypothetical protein